MNVNKNISKRHGVRRPRVTIEKVRRRLFVFVKQNRRHRQTQLTSQYNIGPNRMFSGHTVKTTLLNLGIFSKSPNIAPVLSSITVNYYYSMPKTSGLSYVSMGTVALSNEPQFFPHYIDALARERCLPGSLSYSKPYIVTILNF